MKINFTCLLISVSLSYIMINASINVIPDIMTTFNLSDFSTVQLEAFMLESTNKIFSNENDLVWVSIGNPTLALRIEDKNSKIFYFNSQYFYSYIEMLSNSQKSFLKEAIKFKYNYEIDIERQILNMPLSTFECKTSLYDEKSNSTFLINGKVKDFGKYPLKLQFDYNTNNDGRIFFEKYLDNFENDQVSFECELFSEYLFPIENKFILKLDRFLIPDLFHDLNEIFITKHQLEILADNIYEKFEIPSKYSLSKDLFRVNFLDHFVEKNSNQSFSFVNFEQAIINLSHFGINKDQKIQKKFTELFCIKNVTDKFLIDVLETQNANILLGFNITPIINFVQIRQNEWLISDFLIEDMIKEINNLKNTEIEWFQYDEKILPKSVRVLKLNKEFFNKILKFNNIRTESQVISYKRNITLEIQLNSNKKQSPNFDTNFNIKFENFTSHLNYITQKLNFINNEIDFLKLNSSNNLKLLNKLEQIIECKEDKRIVFQTNNFNPKNCYELFLFNSNNACLKSGVYNIYPDGINALSVYCEANNDGSWTRILNRIDDTIYFDKKYNHYYEGFGIIKNNSWIGLKNIRKLVQIKPMLLRIELQNETASSYIEYDTFYIDTESNGFKLTIENKINGDLPDSFSYHNGAKFSTFDNNQGQSAACPLAYNAGWWFVDCYGFCATCSNKPEALYKPGVWFFPPNYWGVYTNIKMYLRPKF